jgi:glutamyl-Q tRNA(Asp) synthetase
MPAPVQHQEYVGRFAPSPTGDLHFGSLVAAVGSYLQARKKGGKWLVRVEDIDPPREVPGSAKRILRDLARLGMVPDEPVLFQASRLRAYTEACQALLLSGHAFFCACSRKQLPASGIYPGTCRDSTTEETIGMSVRVRVNDEPVRFTDLVMGGLEQRLGQEIGDFVIRRADGLPAYQLAVVLDDAHQGVTEVVRGADLLDSTPRQVYLQRLLGLPTPDYVHLPVVVTVEGEKLSKRLQSDPVRRSEPAEALREALDFLRQAPPRGLQLDRLWQWAIAHWDTDLIPRERTVLTAKDTGRG